MGTLNSVNDRLNYLVKIKKMSDAKFMRETGTNNIGKMRSGKMSVTEGTISRICKSLGVSYDWLKYGNGEMESGYTHSSCFPHSIGDNLEKNINEALGRNKDTHLIGMFNVGNNSQNISTGTERAKDDRIELLEEKNRQLIEMINAKDETIRSLRALLKANKIDY